MNLIFIYSVSLKMLCKVCTSFFQVTDKTETIKESNDMSLYITLQVGLFATYLTSNKSTMLSIKSVFSILSS